MMFLFINTAEDNKTEAALIEIDKDDEVKVVSKVSSKIKSDRALEVVDKLLGKNKITPKKLKGVFAVNGPGPFTAVRIGIALANTFSYALNIPVFGIEYKEGEKIKEMVDKTLKMVKNIKLGEIVRPIENV